MSARRTVSRVAALLLLALPGCGGEPPAEEAPEPFAYVPAGSPADMGLAGYAKVVCSAVFVSGRDPQEAARNSGYFLLPEDRRGDVSGPEIDRERGIVTMVHGAAVREPGLRRPPDW